MATTFGSSRLGVSVVSRTAPPSRGIPTGTDTWFVAAVTDVGPTDKAIEVRDLAQFEDEFGARTAGNIELWDALDVFFREGGKRAYIARGDGAAAADITDAADLFVSGLGPGQVSAIGFPLAADADVAEALWPHAQANNRFAIADVPDATDASALEAYGALLQDLDTNDGSGAVFGPHVMVPPPAGVLGASPRKIPASPVIAALCARVDETGNPNQAAAGRWLPLQYVSELTYDVGMDERANLLDAGVNLMGEIYGVLENYGFQTPVEQNSENPFWQANCSRMRMALVAQALAIGENYMFRPIDGQGARANAFKTDLEAMLLTYFSVGALYGREPEDAFLVQVGETVNTDDTIAQGRLRAVASVVLSLHAKAIEIELVSVPVGGQV